MAKHTQTVRWQKPTNCLIVFHHSVGLALKGLRYATTKVGNWSHFDFVQVTLTCSMSTIEMLEKGVKDVQS